MQTDITKYEIENENTPIQLKKNKKITSNTEFFFNFAITNKIL